MFAWQFALLQFTATLNHWTTFVSMQDFYNLLYREEEREMMPFCKYTGTGLLAWSPLARGLLCRPYNSRYESVRSRTDPRLEHFFLQHKNTVEGCRDREICEKVEKIAQGKGVSMASVVLSWVLAKGSLPVVGLSSVSQMNDAVRALSVQLNSEELSLLESSYQPKTVRAHE